MPTSITQKFHDSPRLLRGILLIISGALGLLLTILSYELGTLPLVLLPPEYWVYSGLGVIFLLVFVALLSLKSNSPQDRNRGLASSMISVGIFCTLSFLLRIASTGWAGNTTMLLVMAFVAFAISLAARHGTRNVEVAKQS